MSFDPLYKESVVRNHQLVLQPIYIFSHNENNIL